MKKKNILNVQKVIYPVIAALVLGACNKDHGVPPIVLEKYVQMDQMARPAINTVFVGSNRKDEFNTTVPSAMNAAFLSDFVHKLEGFAYTSNILGLDKNQFAGVLVTDVLNVSKTDVTSFYDGTHVLTGRALNDDVIDAELTLIFGGATGASNAGLTSDHVNGNDKPFLASFPYLANPH
jgi:uncharacterized protein DUF4331